VKSCIAFSPTFILFVTGEKCGHALNRLIAHLFSVGQARSPGNATTNTLFARFLRCQAAFAMLLA
jgi:hypothetical protein